MCAKRKRPARPTEEKDEGKTLEICTSGEMVVADLFSRMRGDGDSDHVVVKAVPGRWSCRFAGAKSTRVGIVTDLIECRSEVEHEEMPHGGDGSCEWVRVEDALSLFGASIAVTDLVDYRRFQKEHKALPKGLELPALVGGGAVGLGHYHDAPYGVEKCVSRETGITSALRVRYDEDW